MEENKALTLKESCKSYKELESYRFKFGKYIDQMIWDVAIKDPQYLKWLWINARMKLSPNQATFIYQYSTDIKTAIEKQDLAERDVF